MCSLKSDIISSAKFHARPADGFDWDVIAALMGANVAREKRGARWIVDNLGDPLQYNIFRKNNVSTGVANTRPETVIQIINGIVPLPKGKILNKQYKLLYENQFAGCKSDGVVDENDYRNIHDILQSDVVALDILGANVERGIDRAITTGKHPSIFNLGNWLWGGVQEPEVWWEGLATGRAYDPLIAHGAEPYGYEHGFVMVKNISRSAQELGLGSLSNFNSYNKNPSNASLDEGVFVECELRYSPILTFAQNPGSKLGVAVNEVKDGYAQNPSCGKTKMTRAEFKQQYGAVLNQFGIP